jgi:hypothetical protein
MRNVPTEVDAAALLACWERAVGQPPARRDDALLQALAGELAAAERPLGERNAMLVDLHARLFGPAVSLTSRCPRCATVIRFDADCAALAPALRPRSATSTQTLDVGAHRVEFRLPRSDDIEAAAHAASDADFAERVIERCVVRCTDAGRTVAPSELPHDVRELVSQRMEALDPGAWVSFALQCPECGAGWDAKLDPGELVWQKVRAEAERLLLDVDDLARAYGWTEAQVLALSPLRRAAYVQLAAG